jgi:hypothetical protein
LNYIKLISNSEDISVLQGTRTNRLLDAENNCKGKGKGNITELNVEKANRTEKKELY